MSPLAVVNAKWVWIVIYHCCYFFKMLLHCVFVNMQVYLLNPIENLRSYINNRPPLVIFMITVSALAIAFLTIGYFFKIKEIKSPELTEVRLTHVCFKRDEIIWSAA